MINITTIENAIRTWIVDELGIEAIFANANAPRPETDPYALVNIINSSSLGTASSEGILLPDDSADISYSSLNRFMVSINLYREEAFSNAEKLKDSIINKVLPAEKLFEAGLGYERISEVRDIPTNINVQFEERAQFDIFFFIRSLDVENIETIKKVELTNEIDGSTTII